MTAERREDTKASGERVAKVIARAGVASRRDAEALIADGRVKVNGEKLTSPAVVVGPADEVRVDGEIIPQRLRTRAWLFHKPKGLVTTNRDPEGRRTIFDALPQGLPRVVTVGRLDINTEGLLILTNDGGLARVLELPATGWTRKYRVRVHGAVDEAALKGLADGTAVDGTLYGPIHASVDRAGAENSWLTLALAEGKNREVKVVLGSLGLEVTRLIRVSFGPFQLADLPRGEVREVPTKQLKDQLGARLAAQAGADFEAAITAPVRRAKAMGSRAPAGRAHRDRAGGKGPISRASREAGGRGRDRPGDEKEGRRGDKPQRSAGRARPDRSAQRDSGPKRSEEGRSRQGSAARGDRPQRSSDGTGPARSQRARTSDGEAARSRNGPFRTKPRSDQSAARPDRQAASESGSGRQRPYGGSGDNGQAPRAKPAGKAERREARKSRSQGRTGGSGDGAVRSNRSDGGAKPGGRSRGGGRPAGGKPPRRRENEE